MTHPDPHPALPAAEGWQAANTAPETAEWVQLGYPPDRSREPTIIVAHFAQDMSGEEQPPFKGWFRANLGDGGRVYGFSGVPAGWVAWRPLWPKKEHTQAAVDVLAERRRQIEAERWTEGHDDTHTDRSLAAAAAAYAFAASIFDRRAITERPSRGLISVISHLWPRSWGWEDFKPKSPREDLVRAGALILAEIERLDRRGTIGPATGTEPSSGA